MTPEQVWERIVNEAKGTVKAGTDIGHSLEYPDAVAILAIDRERGTMQKKLESVVADAETEVGEIESSLCRVREALRKVIAQLFPGETSVGLVDVNVQVHSEFIQSLKTALSDSPGPCRHEKAVEWALDMLDAPGACPVWFAKQFADELRRKIGKEEP